MMLAPDQLTLVLRHLHASRPIDGLAALLLPFDEDGRPDLDSLARLVEATYAAGLTPVVNSDAGYVSLLAPEEQADVLAVTAGVARGRRFVSGAAAGGGQSDLAARYAAAIERIGRQGGTALIVPCAELTALGEDAIVDVHREATLACPGTLTSELGAGSVPFGRVYSLDLFQRLMDVPTLAGLHHASQNRLPEWYRLEARDARRPEFRIYTGNDLAIDMVAYGSDYLLAGAGLVPGAFRLRDLLWAATDARVTLVGDALQYLCSLACRGPAGAYRHSLAQLLHARGLIACASPHPQSPRRTEPELALLGEAAARIEALQQSVTCDPPFPLSAALR